MTLDHGFTAELAGRFVLNFSAIVAVVSAADGKSVVSFGCAAVALACVAYGRYREQMAADKRQRRLDAFEDAVTQARIKLIGEGKPDPYPHGLPFEAEVNQALPS